MCLTLWICKGKVPRMFHLAVCSELAWMLLQGVVHVQSHPQNGPQRLTSFLWQPQWPRYLHRPPPIPILNRSPCVTGDTQGRQVLSFDTTEEQLEGPVH